MPNACFVDTNLLLYAQDRRTPAKADRITEILGDLADREDIVINPQVLKEYAYNVLRKFPDTRPDQLQAQLELMQPWCRAPLDGRTAIQGLQIHRRYRFAYFDSCLIASALEYGCKLFLSEDMNHGQTIAHLRIVNPFLAESASLIAHI